MLSLNCDIDTLQNEKKNVSALKPQIWVWRSRMLLAKKILDDIFNCIDVTQNQFLA